MTLYLIDILLFGLLIFLVFLSRLLVPETLEDPAMTDLHADNLKYQYEQARALLAVLENGDTAHKEAAAAIYVLAAHMRVLHDITRNAVNEIEKTGKHYTKADEATNKAYDLILAYGQDGA